METLINPYILYAVCLLGGLGVLLALPRKSKNLQIVGAVVAAGAAGLGVLMLTLRSIEAVPSIYFYIFAPVALLAGLRVITHPRPVYAALYFILTIIATSGMFLLLSAEFMAFALIIVYAGAILITYLFVIMLATQAPTDDDTEGLAGYDLEAREPVAATVAGFLLLAVLTTMMFRGAAGLTPASERASDPLMKGSDAVLTMMPRRVEEALRASGELKDGEKVAVGPYGMSLVDVDRREVTLAGAEGTTRTVAFPEGLASRNIDGLGFTMLGKHPGTIEIAGVILLMAMLGAVVLSRKQVQLDEEAKARHAQTLAESAGGSAA